MFVLDPMISVSTRTQPQNTTMLVSIFSPTKRNSACQQRTEKRQGILLILVLGFQMTYSKNRIRQRPLHSKFKKSGIKTLRIQKCLDRCGRGLEKNLEHPKYVWDICVITSHELDNQPKNLQKTDVLHRSRTINKVMLFVLSQDTPSVYLLLRV